MKISAYFYPLSLAIGLLVGHISMSPSIAFAQLCEDENPSDLEQTKRSLQCRITQLKFKKSSLRDDLKDKVMTKANAHQSSPEAIGLLRSIGNSHSRIVATDRYRIALAQAKDGYVNLLQSYSDLLSTYARDSSLALSFSDSPFLKTQAAELATLVHDRRVSLSRLKFNFALQVPGYDALCREYRLAGGFVCSYSTIDFSIAEAHLEKLDALLSIANLAVENARVAQLEAANAEQRRKTMAFEASAAFFQEASTAMRAYIAGPTVVNGHEVYVDFLQAVDALIDIPCETPATYQLSGCKTIASNADSARAFRARLPGYIRAELPKPLYESIRTLPLEDQVREHERFFRGGQ